MSASMGKKFFRKKPNSNASTSDEEENELLKDCIDTEMFQTNSEVSKEVSKDNNKPQKKSIRDVLYGDNDIVDEKHLFESTPGFRDHVSKKLSQFLDSEIQEVASVSNSLQPDTESIPSGFKLLSASKPDAIKCADNEIKPIVTPQRKRKVESSDSDSDTEKFASIAVTTDYIIENSAMPSDIKQKQITISNNCIHIEDTESKKELKGNTEQKVPEKKLKKKTKHKKKKKDND
ncbi:uncharacterized protein LOC141900469 [Tubulanus polymorphus]|uniref:uncharacterized protein LOC141900469 n=1 Tax=Tubulanus polymorphus TaxID=672921 RepID=UPI003DA3A0CA